MIASSVLYASVVVLLGGLILTVKPRPRLGVPTRRRALAIAAVAAVAAAVALHAPSLDSSASSVRSRLDEFAPSWQFHEVHTRRVAAPPDRVFAAIKEVRAGDILLFQTLTWIRRGGRPVPQNILNAGGDEPILDVAVRGGFVLLAADAPRELVVGAVVAAPRGPRAKLTAEDFRRPFPPGFAVAVMNFAVEPDGRGASLVSTETRVFTTSPDVRRRFAAYWRAIYPGSALIRRMWLRAIDRRARVPTRSPVVYSRRPTVETPPWSASASSAP